MKISKIFVIGLASLLGLGTISTAVSAFSSVENATEASAATSSTATLKVSSMSGKTSYDDGHGKFTWTSAPTGTTSYPWSGYYWSLANNQTITFTWTRPAGMQVTDVYTFNNILRSTIAKTGTALSRRMVTTCGIYSLDRAGETIAARNHLLIKSYTTETRTPQMANVTFSITNTSGQTGYFIAKNDDTSPLKIEYETITSTVTFDKQSGSGGSSSVSAEYNKSMPDITVPIRTGYNFLGYYDAKTGGTQYYTSAGKSAKNWDKDSKSATLYAHWEAAEQTVNVTAGTGVSQVYLSTSSTATSGSASGSKFNSGVTVYAFAKLKKGYNHQSSWAKVSGTDDTEGAIYRVASQQVGTSTVNFGTINASLATYTINYNLNGGSVFGTNPTSYNVNSSAITLINPTKTGYSFTGWSGTGISGTSTSVTIPTGSAGARNYTANFEANKYQVTFDATDGQGGIDDLVVTYDSLLPNLTSDQIPSLAPYEGHSYSFGGYFTEQPTPNGDGSYTPHGKQYYDKDGKGLEVWHEASDTTLYAYYTVDMEVTSSGYSGTWDGENHGISVNVNFPEGTTTYYGNSASSCNNPNASDFLKSGAGTYEIYYEVRLVGYTPFPGHETITINKDVSIVDPRPTAVTGLIYTSNDQELIHAGEVDYGTMLYAVNTTGELPNDEEFKEEIPTGKLVNKYFVFYKSSGDSNHNEYTKSLANVVEVNISRVDRTEVSNLNEEVKAYLDTIKDNPDYASIAATLEGVRAEVENDAIVEDNITAAEVANNVVKLQEALSAAKVAVTEALIAAIGTVSYPESKDAIKAAEDYFNSLSEEEKVLVNGDLLNTLEKDATDYDAAKEVADLINAIPEPSDSEEYQNAVKAANDAYAALAESNPDAFDLLNNAIDEDYEKVLEDNVDAAEVIELIKDIGDLTYNGGTDDSLEDIVAAEEAYAALAESNPDALALVNQVNHDKLEEARDSYDEVDEVVKLINQIGDVSHGGESDSKESIDAARSAYDSLSEEEKALVQGYNNTYKTLDDDEHVYEALVLIDEIGNVEYTDEKEAEINAAREYYDSLSDDQKAQLGNDALDTLVHAEQSFAGLKKNATTLVIIFLILVGLLLIAGLIVLYRLIKSRKNNKTKALSIAILPVVLVNLYLTGPFLVLYIIIGLTVLVWLANLILAILKKQQKWIFKPKQEIEQKVEPESEPSSNEDEEVKTVTDEQGNTFQIRYIKSFLAKLIQANEDSKEAYEVLKNEVMSYQEVSSRISWHYDCINYKKEAVIKFAIKGKTLAVYFPEVVEKYLDDKHKVEKVESRKFETTPYLYRIKNPRRLGYAKELINDVAKEFGLVKGEVPSESYILPYEPNEPLVKRGLIKEHKILFNKKEEVEVLDIKTDEEGDEIITEKDSSGHIYKTKFVKSFLAKLIQASEEEKEYYNELKNHVLSYEGLSSRVSWNYDSFNLGKKQLIKIGIRRKTLCIYYALEVENVPQKYKVEKIDSNKYDEVSCMYRIDSLKKCENAKQLITNLMRKNHIKQGEEQHEDYSLPFEDKETLLKKELIRKVKIKVE